MPEAVFHSNNHVANFSEVVDIPDGLTNVSVERKDSIDRTDEEALRPSTLSVLNVNYVVKEYVGPWWKGACFRRTRQKLVLDDVSLQLRSGEMTAILGNSGSGKTSLLDVITCRTSGTVTGHVYYNNRSRTRELIAQRATYVMQADRLLPNLTVRETLTYTAQLKLPGYFSRHEIDSKVTQVIMEMGLKHVSDSRVGGKVFRGISGGEQRRLTIAIQLLKNPDMIFLDEPTSGLDSYTARYLVTNLQQLARRGKIVLLTIHQPSSDIFHLFDQIGIMSQGHVVYFGPRDQIVPYFTELGFPCDKYTNPLDRYVDVCSIDRRDKQLEQETFKRFEKLIDEFKSSKLHQDTTKNIIDNTLCSSESFTKRCHATQGPGCIRVICTLLSRMYKNIFRARLDYISRLLLLPMFMIFILIYLGRLQHSQKSILDRIGILYQSSSIPVFAGLINSVASFPALRELYYREARDGLYSTSTFIISYVIHVLPFQLVSSIVFGSIVYWVAGLNPEPQRFLIFNLEVFLLYFWGELVSVGFMGVLSNANLTSSILTCVFSATFIVASGFVKKVSTMVDPLVWFTWMFIFKYSGEIFLANEFEGLEFTCKANASCLPNGQVVIDQMFPDVDHHMGRNFAVQSLYLVVTTVLAILAYKIRGIKHLH